MLFVDQNLFRLIVQLAQFLGVDFGNRVGLGTEEPSLFSFDG